MLAAVEDKRPAAGLSKAGHFLRRNTSAVVFSSSVAKEAIGKHREFAVSWSIARAQKRQITAQQHPGRYELDAGLSFMMLQGRFLCFGRAHYPSHTKTHSQ